MYEYPESIEILVENFRKLKSIGKKSAQRLALHIATMEDENVQEFIDSLLDVKNNIKKCKVCGNLTEKDICSICEDSSRDDSVICIVEDVSNLISIERGSIFRGKYFVLNGLINPSLNINPDDIGIDELFNIISVNDIKEIIFAISPTVEGETTMLFIKELLKNKEIKITRIASGIPVGGNLEFFDDITLMKALEDRKDLN